MFDAGGVLPGVDDVMKNVINAAAVFDLREDERAIAAHFFGVATHHFQIGPHRGSKIGFVDDEKIALGNAWAAFAGDFIATRHVDHLDGVIGQFATEASG